MKLDNTFSSFNLPNSLFDIKLESNSLSFYFLIFYLLPHTAN